MLLFTKPNNMAASRVIIPLSRVFDIYATDCSININYDSGEMVEVAGKFEKKIETVRVTFDTPDEVDKIFRQFYKAINANNNAFYIGNDEKKN